MALPPRRASRDAVMTLGVLAAPFFDPAMADRHNAAIPGTASRAGRCPEDPRVSLDRQVPVAAYVAIEMTHLDQNGEVIVGHGVVATDVHDIGGVGAELRRSGQQPSTVEAVDEKIE